MPFSPPSSPPALFLHQGNTAGSTVLQFAESGFIAFLKTQLDLYRAAAREAGVNLVWEGPQECQVFFDAAQLQKVFAQLLSNALRHTPPRGYIHIRCLVPAHIRTDSFIRVSIADSGEGMNTLARNRAFACFAQDPRSGLEPGTGLSLSKELIELHGGTIALHSEAGKGTEVVVQLPLGRDVRTLHRISESDSRLPGHAVRFLAQIEACIAQNLADARLGTPLIAASLGMGPRQLQRRLREFAGQTPADFVRRQRLIAARDLIARHAFSTMSEVAAAVGMSVSYFYRAYRASFGAPPAFRSE